ncbi:MAG TPA: ABC transporter ATP-binding protein [Treponemataceae bacterium]|nr:ABC transporter ATP-binding protein [Treponemataceae bacterium]
MLQQTIESYVIKKNNWAPWARLSLLWKSLKGRRFIFFIGMLALCFEAFFIFLAPVFITLTIDSILGSKLPSVPFLMKGLFTWLLGPELQGGGILPIPVEAVSQNHVVTEGVWILRLWFRENLWAVALAFIASIIFQTFNSFLSTYTANSAAEHAAKQMRDSLYSHVQDLPYETLLRSQSGDWLQRCTSDVETTKRFLGLELMEMFRTVVLAVFAFPILYSLSPSLTFWGVLVVPFILVYSFGFHFIVEKVFLGADEKEGVLSGIIQENVTGVRVVRAFARQEYEKTRFRKANDKFRDQVFKLIVLLGLFWGVSSFLGLLQVAIVLGAGLFMMSAGTVSLGLLVLFLTYEQQTLWPIRQFGRLLADAGKTRVALGRIAELLALSEEEELDCRNDENSNWSEGNIEFIDVGFTYPDGTRVLSNINFVLEKGKRLAVVGPTGSGKSTLVHLLLRLYEPTEGRIKIGGIDIRNIPKKELRKKISLVLQEGFLYGKNITENIRMGNKDATDDLILGAARAASLHNVVEGFVGGYDTMVGERGVTLSGGQRQRLSLARALVRKSSILILDDSLSAVDTETDRKIREAIACKTGNVCTTMIIISHRLTTLSSADLILVVENGQITASGTHNELMERDGLYRRLADLQEGSEKQG